jgi:calcineurin-like phosphoesterase family protein
MASDGQVVLISHYPNRAAQKSKAVIRVEGFARYIRTV